MKTPRFFSHPATEKLLPEILGERYLAIAEPLFQLADYRCQLTQVRYQPETEATRCWLMLEPRDYLTGPSRTPNNRPARPEDITKALKKHGVSTRTVQAVDPLLFWARHVDLAMKYRRGTLIFAPWITQGELLSFFRGAAVASVQDNFPGSESARQALQEMEIFGNDELMREVTATGPLEAPWNPEEWLQGIRKLPVKDRRAYLSEFGIHLRFWPDPTVFRPVIDYWKHQAADHLPEKPATATGNLWLNHYTDQLNRLLAKAPH